MMHRKKKAVTNMLSCMLCMLLMFAVLYYSMEIYGQIDLATRKSGITRNYMLAMETEGYLSPQKQAALISDLGELGVTNISLTGTTMSPAGYGNPVILCVTGTIRLRSITGINNNWQYEGGMTDHEFKIYQKSTAKY